MLYKVITGGVGVEKCQILCYILCAGLQARSLIQIFYPSNLSTILGYRDIITVRL